MNKLSKEKRSQLILIGLGTVGAVAGLWFLLISAQMDQIKGINVKIANANKEILKQKAAIRDAQAVQAELAECQARLCQIENTMPSGPPYAWVNSMLHKFNTPNYKVEMQIPGSPQFGEVTMFSEFPYHQLDVSVAGTAFYYDIGKFIADFENRFPSMRLQNLNLEPATADEREKLAFHMDIIILTKNDGP
jgi:Tfp pilus assembly protein PilO